MKRRLRLVRKEQTASDTSEDDVWFRWWMLARVVLRPLGVPFFGLLAVLGVGMVVVIAESALFVLGLAAVVVCVVLALRKDASRGFRVGFACLAIPGLALAGHSLNESGAGMWQKLAMIPQKLTLKSSSSRTAETDAEYQARVRARAEARVLSDEILAAMDRYRDLPEEFPLLLDALKKVDERLKQPREPNEDELLSMVRTQYEVIKKQASFYAGSHGETAAYRRVFGEVKK